MVNYYFGSKEKLFAEVMALALTPSTVLEGALSATPHDTPRAQAERIVTAVVGVWEQPAKREPFIDLVRQSMSDEAVRQAMAQFMTAQVTHVLGDHLRGRFAGQRAAGILTAIGGMIFTRYIARLEPMASLPPADVIRIVAPMVEVNLRPPRGSGASSVPRG